MLIIVNCQHQWQNLENLESVNLLKEKNVKRKIFVSLLVIAVLLFPMGCTSKSPAGVSQAETAPLSWLLKFVPYTPGNQLVYNDILTLSADQNSTIPSRQASSNEVVEWWVSIENHFLVKSYVAPLRTDIWGFDAVEVESFLTVMGERSITIVGGRLDTDVFREMLRSFKYAEESYLGYPVFSGIPKARLIDSPTLDPRVFEVMPRAFAIIDGLQVKGNKVNVVLMADVSTDKPPVQDEVAEAKNVIQGVLRAYQEKTTLAYQTGGITAFAYSLGKAGSAFIANAADLRFDETIKLLGRHPVKTIIELSIGPGKLSLYNQVAITFRQKGDDSLLEFVLAYADSATAMTNVSVLQSRLNESYTPSGITGVGKIGPLSQFWTVQSVKAEGSFLRAVVKLSEQASNSYSFSKELIQDHNLLFLYPGSSESIR